MAGGGGNGERTRGQVRVRLPVAAERVPGAATQGHDEDEGGEDQQRWREPRRPVQDGPQGPDAAEAVDDGQGRVQAVEEAVGPQGGAEPGGVGGAHRPQEAGEEGDGAARGGRPAPEVTEALTVRCPVGRGGILLRLLRTGAATIGEGNLIEVACVECRRAERHAGRNVSLVLHRFGMDGVHIESEIV